MCVCPFSVGFLPSFVRFFFFLFLSRHHVSLGLTPGTVRTAPVQNSNRAAALSTRRLSYFPSRSFVSSSSDARRIIPFNNSITAAPTIITGKSRSRVVVDTGRVARKWLLADRRHSRDDGDSGGSRWKLFDDPFFLSPSSFLLLPRRSRTPDHQFVLRNPTRACKQLAAKPERRACFCTSRYTYSAKGSLPRFIINLPSLF